MYDPGEQPAGPRACAERVVQPITPTKLTPPRGARHLMPREALMARLLEARRQRCVVIQGPAGSAKTSTLLAWRQALLTLDFDVAWLSLAPEDNDLTSFFNGLLASLAVVDAAMVRDAAILMGRDGDESAAEHWMITLVRGVASRRRELVLMLDDVHLLDDPRIFQALRWLLDYAPAHLHVALASRNALPLSLARLRSQGLATEFDLRDLRFSPEESERFLRDQLGGIDRRDAQVLHALTGGWAAGLQLFAIDLKAKQGAAYARVQVRDAQTFASYFEREVLVRLTSDELHLLTRMAVCNRFCASLCATLLGRPEEAGEIAARLAHLDADDLFITQIGSGQDRETWYRLHPLLREVLLTRLASLPSAEQHALHAAAWHWFGAQGHIDEAVRHAVQAGDANAAADLVETCAHDLLARGELSELAGLVRRLPPEQVTARFDLHLVLAYLQMYAGEVDALMQSIGQMASQHERLGPRQRYALALLRGGLALQRDDTDSVVALLPELQRVPPDADDFTYAGRGNILSWMFIHRGEYKQARKVLEEGALHGGAPRGVLLGRCMGGMTHAAEGQFLLAERIFCDVLAEAEQQGPAYIGIACMAAALLGEALYELNDVDAARELLEKRIDVLERVSIPDTVLRGLTVLANAHWLGGRRLEARACLDRLEDYAARHRVDRLLAHALYRRSRWLLEQGEVDAAHAVLLRLEALAARYSGAARSTAWEISVCAQVTRIRMCLHHNDFDGAIARLTPLNALSEAGGRWCRVASLRVQMALAEQGRGNRDGARRHLVEALRLGHRLGLMRSLLDVSPRLRAMLDALAVEEGFDPVLGFYAQRLVAATAVPEVVPSARGAANPALDSLSERENEVLGLLAQALPNKKIARVLGVSLDTVKWHLKNIYGKLEVSGRDEAVARMRDLKTAGPQHAHTSR
ncbi:ATP-dependent transcription regulator LuxR [Cupriavidus basilensis OR16]|uniref:ATP-dependent transcription regulator LuxR n=1 Tax=Cupriavidus basilensis OR16 TaxID=1127483 RepID=H1SBR9_9BURK|nr:LuxR C-terminal-related transcriptional regulator [Cupriavidus basilensis]EHP40061.1 ATP-dependent transcription regulator LuxR [Cupriavidus basilensis OR16]